MTVDSTHLSIVRATRPVLTDDELADVLVDLYCETYDHLTDLHKTALRQIGETLRGENLS